MLLKPSLCLEEPIQLSSSDKRHDEEQSELRHKQELHAYEELMLTLEHDVFFQLCILNLVVLNENVFTNNFDCVQLLVHLELSQEHLAECAFAQDHDHLEVS